MPSIVVRVLKGFDDPSLSHDAWSALLAQGDTNCVFLTRPWLQTWWQSFGRGDLLLLLAEHEGRAVALAPLFHDSGMIFFVGSGGSDYLDFIGDVSGPGVLESLLAAARQQISGLLGFRFYHVPAGSRTGTFLQRTAAALQLECFNEGELFAPGFALRANPALAHALPEKRSLVRHERWFQARAVLEVRHWTAGSTIVPNLPEFFEQHVARWSATEHPSLFCDPVQREFYAQLARAASSAGWLRFTRLDWQGQPIAFHFGFCYAGAYLWYKPSFDIEHARRSPGEVLLRQLFLAALDEGAATFDFGLGDEPFKRRFCTHVNAVHTWGLYPVGS